VPTEALRWPKPGSLKRCLATGLGSLNRTSNGTKLFNIFKTNGGFQRFSDPNIPYVNQDAIGTISIGLAGHYDASSLFTRSIDT